MLLLLELWRRLKLNYLNSIIFILNSPVRSVISTFDGGVTRAPGMYHPGTCATIEVPLFVCYFLSGFRDSLTRLGLQSQLGEKSLKNRVRYRFPYTAVLKGSYNPMSQDLFSSILLFCIFLFCFIPRALISFLGLHFRCYKKNLDFCLRRHIESSTWG